MNNELLTLGITKCEFDEMVERFEDICIHRNSTECEFHDCSDCVVDFLLNNSNN